MNCLSLLLAFLGSGAGTTNTGLLSGQQRRSTEPSISERLERIDALTRSDVLFELIRSDKAGPVTDFPEAAREHVLSLVLGPRPSRSGVEIGQNVGETTVTMKVYARIHVTEPDGTYHEFEVRKPEPNGHRKRHRANDSKLTSERVLKKLQHFGIISNEISIDDLKRPKKKVAQLEPETGTRLFKLISAGKAVTDQDAALDFRYDLDRFEQSSVSVSVQVLVTLTTDPNSAAKVYSIR